MNCPKCNSELKPGAKFCHICGFNMQDVQATPPPPVAPPENPVPPVAPVQNFEQPHYQQQQYQQPNIQQPNIQQPVSNHSQYAPVAAPKGGSGSAVLPGILALVGAVGVFLPWVRVSFWGSSFSASGMDAWQGVIALIILLAIGILSFVGDGIKMDPKTKAQLTTFMPVLPAALTFWVLIRTITQSMVNPGIGVFITLLASVALIVIGLSSSSKAPSAGFTSPGTPGVNPQQPQNNPSVVNQQPPTQQPLTQQYQQPQQYQQAPQYGQAPQYTAPMPGQKPQQPRGTMILICFFIGGFGIHRLMMGYSNWWLMIITLGGLGIWTLIDFIRLLTGDMKMADGRPLL